MPYYTETQLRSLGLKSFGRNVKVSDRASIYDPERIELGHDVRIDDFCVISGRVVVGSFVHVTPQCLVAGGVPGVFLEDFTTLAYGARVFAQSDDYSGETLTNSMIPRRFKKELFAAVRVERHAIIGAGAAILPGVVVATGCAIGAMSLVLKSTEPWGIYAGCPVRRIKERRRDLLGLESQFLSEVARDPV